MSDDLKLSRVFETLDALRTAVTDFADRESALVVEYGRHSGTSKSQITKSIDERQRVLGKDVDEETDRYKQERKRLKKRFKFREGRIEKAYKSSRHRRLRDLSKEEGAQVFDAQWKMIKTRQDLANELKETNQQYAVFFDELKGDRKRAAVLLKRTRSSFRGYKAFLEHLASARDEEMPDLDLDRDEFALREDLGLAIDEASADLNQFRKRRLPLLFRILPVSLLSVLIAMAAAGIGYALHHFGWAHPVIAAAGGAGAILIVAVLHFIGKGSGNDHAKSVASRVDRVRRLLETSQKGGETRFTETIARIESDQKSVAEEFDNRREKPIENAEEVKEQVTAKLEEQKERINDQNRKLRKEALDRCERDHEERNEKLNADATAEVESLTAHLESDREKLDSGYAINWETLVKDWRERIEPIYDAIGSVSSKAASLFPPWTRENWAEWEPPADFSHAAQFGHFDVQVAELTEGKLPEDERLALPGPAEFTLPASLSFPWEGSVLFETGKTGKGREEVIASLNNLVFRLLSTCPPGKLAFTIIDPVGLGEGFSGIMHLADHDEALINGKIWTQTEQIERQLGDLNEHIEKVIQMYLRNDFETITEYNRQAESIAEKFHFIVVADFPSGFSEVATERLLSIANSGARCGVYSFIHWDKRTQTLQEFSPDDLAKHAVRVGRRIEDFVLKDFANQFAGVQLQLDEPPEPGLANELIHRFGESSKDANRVEVPFDDVTPEESEFWTGDTTAELIVPIGRTGATKLQYMAIGKGTRQHALIAGKTGSGKSTLFHVMITNLAAWCSPEQVEFYLIDFKKGVEFKSYATHNLPHARVIAIESDREFGLSVIQRVDAELKRRGDLFRKLGVQDIGGYKKAGGTDPIPRTLLMIDEFQELFTEDDRIAQDASVLLDRIVRQGRAFGIHVILGSQTLGGANTIARTTLGQMVIRVALQCNEADAYLIMDDNNPAPRLLSRPGEGIYNDAAGMVEGNSPFQVVWLSDEDKEKWLGKIRTAADNAAYEFRQPIVFEGNAPADIRENTVLKKMLAEPEIGDPPTAARAFLGAPNSIKGPTEAGFLRQSGNNLLIAGQREEAALAIIGVSLVSLSAQYRKQGIRFFLFDSNPTGTPARESIENFVSAIPHEISLCKSGDVETVMSELATEIDNRVEDDAAAVVAPPIFLIVNGLQRFKKLRQEENFSFSLDEETSANSGEQFEKLITEGPSVGVHLIATCDTYNNLNRTLSRKAISEIEMRVLFQMSANDSSNLIDTPKASNLGLHRALFYNEQEGHLETFRPYAIPESEWIEKAGKDLARLVG